VEKNARCRSSGLCRTPVRKPSTSAGQLAQEGQTNIYLSSQWVQLEATIVTALDPYPDAAAAVATALEEVPNGRR